MNMFNAAPGSLAAIKSEPYWWEDAGTPVSPSLQPWPDEVEVLVIGAGLTGLSAARTLTRLSVTDCQVKLRLLQLIFELDLHYRPGYQI